MNSLYIDYLTDGKYATPDGYDISNKSKNAKVINKIIPFGKSRTGEIQDVKYIVIHETSIGLDKASVDRDWLHYYESLLNGNDSVGYHYLCDDDNVYEFIPDYEKAYHTGTFINNFSIGVERLVNLNVSFPDALHNQAKIVATLMYKWGVPLRRVITHLNARVACDKEIKYCPSRMLDYQYGGEKKFYNEVVNCLRKNDFFYEILNVNLTIPKKKIKDKQ